MACALGLSVLAAACSKATEPGAAVEALWVYRSMAALPGDSLTLGVILANVSGATVELVGPSDCLVAVEMMHPDGGVLGVWPRDCPADTVHALLPPREYLRRDLTLHLAADLTPGRYHLRPRWREWSRVRYGEPATLLMLSPP